MAWDDTARLQHSRDGLRYPSDLADREWSLIAPLLPPARRGDRPRTTGLGAVTGPALWASPEPVRYQWRPHLFPCS